MLVASKQTSTAFTARSGAWVRGLMGDWLLAGGVLFCWPWQHRQDAAGVSRRPESESDLPQQEWGVSADRSAWPQQQHDAADCWTRWQLAEHWPPHPQSDGVASAGCSASKIAASHAAPLPASLLKLYITETLHINQRLPASLPRALSAEQSAESTKTDCDLLSMGQSSPQWLSVSRRIPRMTGRNSLKKWQQQHHHLAVRAVRIIDRLSVEIFDGMLAV